MSNPFDEAVRTELDPMQVISDFGQQQEVLEALQLLLCEAEAKCVEPEKGCVLCDAAALVRERFAIAAPLPLETK